MNAHVKFHLLDGRTITFKDAEPWVVARYRKLLSPWHAPVVTEEPWAPSWVYRVCYLRRASLGKSTRHQRWQRELIVETSIIEQVAEDDAENDTNEGALAWEKPRDEEASIHIRGLSNKDAIALAEFEALGGEPRVFPAGKRSKKVYCYIHEHLYETGKTRERDKLKVCVACQRQTLLANDAKPAAVYAVIRELELRLPGLFVAPACPSDTRCECTHLSGCKALAPVVVQEPVARPKTKQEELEARLLGFLKAKDYRGTFRDLSQTLDTDMTLLGKALGTLESRGDITKAVTRGRNGGIVLGLVPA